MPYWDVVTRSFSIPWRHKYLWLIALFSGEASGGFNYQYSQRTNYGSPSQVQEQVSTWINQHAGVLVAAGVIAVVLLVAFFLLAAVCEGATVRAAAEHDADRPFGLRQAWTMGVHTMWVIVRFRLLLLLLYVPLLILIVAWFVALFLAVAGQNGGAAPALILSGVVLLLVFIVYAIYLFFIDRLGTRAAILEERKAIPSIARAHRLLFKRLGRSLVVWLLSIAVAIVVGILLACFSVILALPLVVGLAATAASGSGAFWALLVIALIILVPIYLVLSAYIAAQGSTYWTVAFRRLDVDYPPAFPSYPAPAVTP